jgi:hypothetical protein
MCVAGLPYPLSVINLDILKVKGRSDLFLRIEIVKRSLIVVNALVAFRWGISAILLGQVIISGISYLLNSFYSERLIAYPMKAQILDVLPSLLFAGLMGGGMALVGAALGPTSDFLRLIAQVATGVMIYLALNWLWQSEPLHEVIGMIAGWVARRPEMARGQAG